jgi:hypothetical protein
MLFVLCSSFVVVVESSKCIDTDGEYMNGSSVIYIGLEAEARKNVDVGVCVCGAVFSKRVRDAGLEPATPRFEV